MALCLPFKTIPNQPGVISIWRAAHAWLMPAAFKVRLNSFIRFASVIRGMLTANMRIRKIYFFYAYSEELDHV